MKIFEVTMLISKYIEKNRWTRNKLNIKVFITNRGFCKQTLIGLTGLLWQSLLRQTWTDGFTRTNVNWADRFTWKNSRCASRLT